MDYSITKHNGTPIVQINSLPRIQQITQLIDTLQQPAKKPLRHLILDLSQLPYINISGITLLIRIKTLSRQSGIRLSIANPSPQTTRRLEIAMLSPFFSLYPSVESALKSIA